MSSTTAPHVASGDLLLHHLDVCPLPDVSAEHMTSCVFCQRRAEALRRTLDERRKYATDLCSIRTDHDWQQRSAGIIGAIGSGGSYGGGLRMPAVAAGLLVATVVAQVLIDLRMSRVGPTPATGAAAESPQGIHSPRPQGEDQWLVDLGRLSYGMTDEDDFVPRLLLPDQRAK